MTVHNDEHTLVNVLSYRRDLYQLIVLLLADEKVAADEQFKELSKSNHETEVNRLLILIATATRQFLRPQTCPHQTTKDVGDTGLHIQDRRKTFSFDRHAIPSSTPWK